MCWSNKYVKANEIIVNRLTFPSLVDQSVYDQFVKYTKYAAASYAYDCPVPPKNSSVVSYLSNSTTDTQATVFRSDLDQEIVVAFRGTSDLEDFFTDSNQGLVPYEAVGVDCPSCLVTSSFITSSLFSFTSLDIATYQ